MIHRDWSAGWRHARMSDAVSIGAGVLVRRLRLDPEQMRPAHVRMAAIAISLLIWIALIGFVIWLW